MQMFQFKKIDAFTQGGSSGNPAGCIYLGSETIISDAAMQQIARELKGFVNEVGFLRQTEGEFLLRYFSSECEVEFCGHATIAIMYDLISENKALQDCKELFLTVGQNRLAVINQIVAENAVYIMSPAAQYLTCCLPISSIAAALSINESAINTAFPVRLINAGLSTLIVPIVSLTECLGVLPTQEELRIFCVNNDIDIILLFCQETQLAAAHYRTRVFAPKYGYLEDQATGSGNAAFGNYLLSLKLWQTGSIVIEQGSSHITPNIVKLRVDHTGKRVLFGGASVLRINGHYCLQN